MKLIADLHCHTTLRPYNVLKNDVFFAKKPLVKSEAVLINYSQSDMAKLYRGNVKIVFASLYPMEQGFFNSEIPVANDTLLEALLKFPAKRINAVQDPNHDYFQDLVKEYELLCSQENKFKKLKGTQRFKYKIIKNYAELKNLYRIDDLYNIEYPEEPTIAIILTIEGGHALGCGLESTKDIDPNDLTNSATKALLEKLKKNIRTIKNWKNGEHCPLFITFTHHFWNQLCGHSISMYDIAHKIYNQRYDNSFSTPFTRLGEEIIKELLSEENGRRILIDTKHMTIHAKKWYYKYLNDNNIDVPLIASHSAVNAAATLDDSYISNSNHKDADKKYEDSKIFNNWDINVSDEEIFKIYKSGGIIGINLDERILTGNKLRKRLKSQAVNAGNVLKKSLWAEPVYQNIIHIAQTLKNNNVNNDELWDNICIGSDFDGIINPLDGFRTSEDLDDLAEILRLKFIERILSEPLLKNKSNEEIETIVDKFMYKNVLKFLDKYFG